ncbi:unnamed protein product [Rotaria magnacalcarata]|uniref:Amine oxidase domain-containing protein n=4 Tax=Rotaria magnacalcarata TaxID=392030 RepID=A0A816CB20_9BILA|nr:unnamed protein product [Rotaria magnacalcarata]
MISNNEGADLDAINAKAFLDINSLHYGRWHIFDETGYMALTDYLARDLDNIRLEQVVKKIVYNEKFVEVSTTDGQVYRAEFVLITVPLGVMKSKQIEFNPSLPQWKLDAIDRIGFGTYEKLFLLWDRPWWNFTGFHYMRIPSESTEFRYWVIADKSNDKPVLACHFSGRAAIQLKSKLNQDEIVEEIRGTLQKMFPDIVIPQLVASYMTNWNQDPFSYGSYSYISVKQKYEDPLYLAEQINDRLLFAGEATSTDAYGYTHGALLSARREVTRLLFVYDLLPTQNLTTSRSAMTIPLEGFIIIIISFIWLQLCGH